MRPRGASRAGPVRPRPPAGGPAPSCGAFPASEARKDAGRAARPRLANEPSLKRIRVEMPADEVLHDEIQRQV